MSVRVRNKHNQWIRTDLSLTAFQENPDVPITIICYACSNLNPNQSKESMVLEPNKDFFSMVDTWLKEIQPEYILTIACDLNNFKLYNELFGRAAGDDYLLNFKKFLQRYADQYHGKVSYMGGDDFCLVIPTNTWNENHVKELINEAIDQVGFQDGFLPAVGVSVSRSVNEFQSFRYDHAVVAMNTIRGIYRSHIAVYDARRYEQQQHQQMLLMGASQSLKDREFQIFVQPKVELTTGKIIGGEALVRWIKNDEIIPPADFIGAMEKNGFITAVDRHVWELACKWQASLIQRGLKPYPISVNVSRIDQYFMDIPNQFIYLIQKYNISPELIEIEITESAYAENAEALNESLRRLREYGFRVLLDDFGTGYSTLHMLQDCEVDVLKLDRSFLFPKSESKTTDLLQFISNMSRSMNLEMIAEGVETKQQCDVLHSIGCVYGQGFYFYRPMPLEEFEKIAYEL